MVTTALEALVGEEPATEALDGALATIPADALPDALRTLAREHGAAAVPILRHCLSGRPEWASAAAAALGTVPSPEAAAALRTAEGRRDSKAVRTAVRRALYRLRQAGVAPPPAPAAPARVPAVRPADAWASAIDGTGARGLWLTVEGPYGERVLLAAVISDEVGILDFSGGPVPKKRLDERLRELRAESALPWVALPTAWAWRLLDEAAARTRAAGGAVPRDLEQWLARLGPPPDEPAPAPARLPESADDVAAVERSAALLEEPELAGWFLDPAALASEAVEWLQARESRLVLSEPLKAERLAALVDRVIERHLPPEAGGRWARRLEEEAHVFLELGREPVARSALAVARALLRDDPPARRLPFVRALVERSLEVAGEVATGRLSVQDASRAPRPAAGAAPATGG